MGPLKLSAGSLALAVGAVVAASTAPAHASDETTESESYALPLGLSYLALPALAGGAVALFPDANENAGAALAAGVIVLGLAAPVSVHLAYSEPVRAVVSPLGAAGSTVVLGLVGLGVGTIVASSRCGSREDESSSSCRLPATLLPAYAGAFLGYVGWAIYDTAANSSVSPSNGPKIGVAPVVSRVASGVRVFGSF